MTNTTVWYRESEDEEWRPAAPSWTAIDKERAHEIADRYNSKYSHGMWWVNPSQPSKDKTVI